MNGKPTMRRCLFFRFWSVIVVLVGLFPALYYVVLAWSARDGWGPDSPPESEGLLAWRKFAIALTSESILRHYGIPSLFIGIALTLFGITLWKRPGILASRRESILGRPPLDSPEAGGHRD